MYCFLAFKTIGFGFMENFFNCSAQKGELPLDSGRGGKSSSFDDDFSVGFCPKLRLLAVLTTLWNWGSRGALLAKETD